MRLLFLPLFALSLLAFFVAVGVDVYIALATDVWMLQSVGAVITLLGFREWLGLFQVLVERYLWPDLWWSFIEPLLHEPAVIVTCVASLLFGGLFYWAHRRKQIEKMELISSVY